MNWEKILRALESTRADQCHIAGWQVQATSAEKLSLGIKDREAGNIHAPLSLAESSNARYLLIWSDQLISRGLLERQQAPDESFGESRAAAYADPDGAHVLGPAEFPELKLYDESVAKVALGETAPIAERLDRVRGRIDAAPSLVKSWSGSFSASRSESRLRTSAGLDVASRGTSTGWYVSLNGEVGDGYGARRFETIEEFDQRLDALTETARAVEDDSDADRSGELNVLLHPRVVEGYVLSTLYQNLDGAAVAHEEGAFELKQFGDDDPVLRDDIQLSIDPWRPYHSGSYRFTGFGLPSAPCEYVRDGRLVQPILDVKYGRRLGLPPTPVPFGSDTVEFGSAQRLGYAEALERADVMVLSVLGIHTQDRVSGDFSLSAPLSLAVASGGFEGRLRGTISGNLWQLLRASETTFVEMPLEHSPAMLVRCRFDRS